MRTPADGPPRPLAGVGVLVTRPERQAEELCRLIEMAGGEAICWPLLEIVPVAEEAEGPARLRALSEWDWLIFVSANAANFGLDCIERGAEQPAWPKVAAIGPATASVLERRGVAVDLAPKQQSNSEALLALPEFAVVSGQRFLIVRGEGGRALLGDTLVARGAQVAYAEVYRRIASQADVSPLLQRWRHGALSVVTITSGEALNHLSRLLSDNDAAGLLSAPLVVIGERMAQQARMLGWAQVTVAEAGDVAMTDAVIAVARSGRGFTNDSNYGDTALVDQEKEVTPVANEPTNNVDFETFADDRPSAAPKKSRVGSWMGYVILLVVLALTGGGFFILQELRSKQEGLGSGLDKGDKQMQALLNQIAGFQTELAALHSQFATLQSQVTTEDSKFERQIGEQGSAFGEKLDDTKSELTASIEHIQRQLNKTRGDMMVADAEYLLSVANQKLHLVGDVKAVLAAMAAADQRLHDSGDPGVFKVREALAQEINQLEALQVADVVGLSAKLLALEAKVRELPLFLPHSDKGKGQKDQSTGDVPESGGLLDSTLQDIKGLVTVRRTDRPVQAVLLPEEVEALRQVLLLRMEMARASLLRGDDGLFKTNLDSVLSWLDEHFDHDSTLVKGIADEISALKTQQIRVPFPDISKSLTLLRNIEKLRLEEEEKGKSGSASPVPEVGAQP